jgi:hypothetical protein
MEGQVYIKVIGPSARLHEVTVQKSAQFLPIRRAEVRNRNLQNKK